ncbi:MAG: SAM-dependent methyltransferase, partial [Muribaculaceae bacterium]|nr:SAM-dependent methyltransferase [Muribaculaceae bacterium]
IVIDDLHFELLNEHTRPEEVDAMLGPALEGHDIGVISEAGCPAVADPGADLVAAAQRRGIQVGPLVGPSSILMSLMGSGFNGQSFTFLGYLPVDARRRADRLRDMEREIRRDRRTQIFIETPYRNNRLIAELASSLPGQMLLCVASDITGEHQSIITRPLADWKKASYDYDKRPTIFLLYS